MRIDPKNAIIARLGACLLVGGFLIYKRSKENEQKMKEMQDRVQFLIKDVPEIVKPSR